MFCQRSVALAATALGCAISNCFFTALIAVRRGKKCITPLAHQQPCIATARPLKLLAWIAVLHAWLRQRLLKERLSPAGGSQMNVGVRVALANSHDVEASSSQESFDTRARISLIIEASDTRVLKNLQPQILCLTLHYIGPNIRGRAGGAKSLI